MSTIHTVSFDQMQNSDIDNNENFDNDDLISFQHASKKIYFYYSQLTKYSKHIRDSYLFSDVNDRFPQEIQKFQEESQLLPESFEYFFQLLQQNYNINDYSALTYINCIDLLKISKFLEVRKLSYEINQYISSHKVDVDFIIQMIQYEIEVQKESNDQQIYLSKEIEQVLTSKIQECLTNEKFKDLPIQIIYRIVSRSSQNSINSNKLFDIIMRSISKYCVLFQYLDLKNLSEDRLDDLCEIYSNSDENTQQYFSYLKCDLNFIKEISKRKKNLEETNENQKSKMDDLDSKIELLQKQFNASISELQSKLKDSNESISELQSKLKDSNELISELQSKLKDSNELNNEHQIETNELKTKFSSLQEKFSYSEQLNEQLQNQLKDSKGLISEQQSKINDLQNKLSNSEQEINNVQKQLNKMFLIKGKISAKVENGLVISAEIDLKEKGSPLDTSRSKFIFSTSGEKLLGSEAYEKGEPITSLHMKTPSYLCRPGTYFVRCIVFNMNGESNEIVSNPVTTSGSCATFRYEGKAAKIISLYQGKYKLEVWGAKGGDSTGNGRSDGDCKRGKQSSVEGGLGGYSRGILNLNQVETVYVYVGEKGRASDASEGSVTEGGFPDGGGTKTGHNDIYTTVPGTGGGSTSIRIGSDTNFARVIVAGGGGGASGDSLFVCPGGFGGGLNGGNCTYKSSLQSQGAGTQIGSTQGLGNEYSFGRLGDPGQFGLGATGKYNQRCDSGGGGGGGWYGGGSGGYGCGTWCSSGGGGSGWTFTESHYNTWKSGDSSNASKFVLNSSHYLSDEDCKGGNEEFPKPDGNGTERGHNGSGYAKITPL